MMLTIEEIKSRAAAIAAELKAAANIGADAPAPSGGGSRQRGLPEDLRTRFIEVRTALFHRGIYDPILVRFDTATVAQASTAEIAEQLLKVADSL